MKIHWKKLILCLALPTAVGGLAALLTGNAMKNFNEMIKPWFAPPSWAFAVVWPILYLMMGLASYLVWTARSRRPGKRVALGFYLMQLFFNFWWSIFFFSWQAYLFSLIWLAVLWALIAVTALLFRPFSRGAFWLMLPYFLWVGFAGCLNFAIYRLN